MSMPKLKIEWATPEIWIWRDGHYYTQVSVREPPDHLKSVKYVQASAALTLAARVVGLETQLADGGIADISVKAAWESWGGEFHGPNIEHATIEENRLYSFAREMYRRGIATAKQRNAFVVYDDQPIDHQSEVKP